MPHQNDSKGYYGIAGTMDIRQILADNLEQLQARHKDLQSTPAVERATAVARAQVRKHITTEN